MERWNVIPVVVILLLVAQGVPGAFGEDFTSDVEGIAFLSPEGWESAQGRGATVVKFRPPRGGGLTEIAIIAAEQGTPMTLDAYVAQLKEFNAKSFESGKLLDERPETVAGFPARRLHFTIPTKSGKELHLVQTVVRRSPMSFYSLDLSWVKEDEGAVGDRYEGILKSFRSVDRRWSKAEDAAYRRFAEAVDKLADVRKEVCLAEQLAIYAGDRKIGTYRTTIEEAVVEGRRGYKMTTALTIDAEDRGRETITTECAFTFDFKHQQSRWEDRKVLADGKEQVFRMNGTIVRDEARIERDLCGVKESEVVPLGGRRVLFADAAEVFRKILLGEAGNDYLTPVLPLGDNRMTGDRMEISRGETATLHGVPFKGDMLLLTRERSGSRVFFYDPAKYLVEERIVRSPIVLRREEPKK